MTDILAEAYEELANKTREDIERETAWKWAARAIAAYRLGRVSDAVDFAHEAIEHSASADRVGDVLRAVRAWIDGCVPPGAI